MKWGSVELQQGQLNWSGADAVVNFAPQNDQVIRGHALIWHSQLFVVDAPRSAFLIVPFEHIWARGDSLCVAAPASDCYQEGSKGRREHRRLESGRVCSGDPRLGRELAAESIKLPCPLSRKSHGNGVALAASRGRAGRGSSGSQPTTDRQRVLNKTRYDGRLLGAPPKERTTP